MRSRKQATTALLAACVGGVVTVGTLTPAARATGVDDARSGHDSVRLIVPRGPGERVDAVSARSPLVRMLTVQSQQSERPNMADRMFAKMMIPHHYQAIVMTRLAPKRAKGKRVRAIADRIRAEQSIEIDSLQGWQGRSGLSVTDEQHSYQHMLHDHDMLEEMGMATPKQMKKLRAADGRAFDKMLLRLMIPHHKGAIRMAEDVATDGNDLFLRQMAVDMIDSQSRQVYDMRQILKDITH